MPTLCTPTTCSFARCELVARELERIAPGCVWGETIARLRCLRGINTLTALGLCAEIGDWKRFEHPDAIAKMRRAGPVRAQLRPDPPAGQDHQGRLHPRAPAAGRGRAALPPHAGGRRQARDPPTRPTPNRDRSRLARPAPVARALEAAARRPRQTGRRGHDRDRSRADRRLLGDRHRHLTPGARSRSGASRRRGGPGIAHTRTSALSPVSQPARPRGRPRSITDSGRRDKPRS
jgi:hypothetical protein